MTKLTIITAALIAAVLLAVSAGKYADAASDAPVLRHFEITTSGDENGRYWKGDYVIVGAAFDRIVTVDEDETVQLFYSGYPPVYFDAEYYDGSGTNLLRFRHRIGAYDTQRNNQYWEIPTGSFTVQYNGDDYKINHSSYDHNDPKTIPNIPKAKYVRFASSPPNGFEYRIGEYIRVDVEFNKRVYVDTSAGSIYSPDYPAIMLAINSGDRRAHYISGNGTKILRFQYQVRSGDLDTNGAGVRAGILEVYTDADLDDDSFEYSFIPKKRSCSDHEIDYREEVIER